MEKLTGDTIDISEYLDFDFYDLVWYWDTLSGEKGEAFPGRCLRVSNIVGACICYWVLNKQGTAISRYNLKYVTKEYILNKKLKETLELDDKNIKEKIADENHELESCPENRFFHKDILLYEVEER